MFYWEENNVLLQIELCPHETSLWCPNLQYLGVRLYLKETIHIKRRQLGWA